MIRTKYSSGSAGPGMDGAAGSTFPVSPNGKDGPQINTDKDSSKIAVEEPRLKRLLDQGRSAIAPENPGGAVDVEAEKLQRLLKQRGNHGEPSGYPAGDEFSRTPKK